MNNIRKKLHSRIVEYVRLFDSLDEKSRSVYIVEISELSPDPDIMNYVDDLQCFHDEIIVVPYGEIERIVSIAMSKERDIIRL